MKIILLIAFVIVGSSQIFARPSLGRPHDDSRGIFFGEFVDKYDPNTSLDEEAIFGDNKNSDMIWTNPIEHVDKSIDVSYNTTGTLSEEVPLNEDEEFLANQYNTAPNDFKIIAKREVSAKNEPLNDPNYISYQLTNDGNNDDSDKEETQIETVTEIIADAGLSSAQEDAQKESKESKESVEDVRITSGVNMEMYSHGYPQIIEVPSSSGSETVTMKIYLGNMGKIKMPMSLEDTQKESEKSEKAKESVEDVNPNSGVNKEIYDHGYPQIIEVPSSSGSETVTMKIYLGNMGKIKTPLSLGDA